MLLQFNDVNAFPTVLNGLKELQTAPFGALEIAESFHQTFSNADKD